ncbi:hypothetical protein B9Y74_05555 [Stenotrophomonas maltophilia]|uniref:hypothetical protein n=1 Tax=Stenotrophomonas maltophilia TaxID=40324 RepID=UPI000C2588DE|nr:hypothetical protein [Stenotrophomonas maltophilia]PJL51462.1 hypothetical protein B9Y74_05555 [Stenotrophomonas maltophilia]
MTTSVDVLAVMDSAIETYMRLNREARSEEDHLLDIEDAQAARAAVAELIEAVGDLSKFGDEIEWDDLSAETTDMSSTLWRRADAALARVKGA